MIKPVNPKTHGIIDYAFSGIQILGPALIGLNFNTIKTYQALATIFLGMNAVTHTPVAAKKIISFKSHQKVDAGFLISLSLLTLSNFIRKDKRTLSFHVGFLGIAIAHYILTDYNKQPSS